LIFVNLMFCAVPMNGDNDLIARPDDV